MGTTVIKSTAQSVKTEQWFDNLVATVRSHEAQLASDIASDELKNFYNGLINQNFDDVSHLSMKASVQYFISKMLVNFLYELRKSGQLPVEIALQLAHNGINVWAVINDDDEATERALFESEAKTNALFNKYGFRIDTTVLELSDHFDIPNQFNKVPIHT